MFQFSQVYQKQMSGGVVHTSEDHFLDDGLNSQELQDLFGIESEVAGFNIPVDTPVDEFLQTCEAPNALGLGGERNPMFNQIRGDFHQQQWNNPQSTPAYMAQFTDAFGHCYPAQQFDYFQENTSQLYQTSGHKKRGSFGNDDGSDGYASDLSPSHEPQTSPTPSPRSMMDSSPAAMNGSPPRTNYSPPLSNLSYCSADSGVGSPMTDELNEYSSQVSLYVLPPLAHPPPLLILLLLLSLLIFSCSFAHPPLQPLLRLLLLLHLCFSSSCSCFSSSCSSSSCSCISYSCSCISYSCSCSSYFSHSSFLNLLLLLLLLLSLSPPHMLRCQPKHI